MDVGGNGTKVLMLKLGKVPPLRLGRDLTNSRVRKNVEAGENGYRKAYL